MIDLLEELMLVTYSVLLGMFRLDEKEDQGYFLVGKVHPDVHPVHLLHGGGLCHRLVLRLAVFRGLPTGHQAALFRPPSCASDSKAVTCGRRVERR